MNTDTIEEAKQAFAEAFVRAVAAKSVTQCKALMLSYEEWAVILGKIRRLGLRKKAYEAAIEKQCRDFFDKRGAWIDEQQANPQAKIAPEYITKVALYGFEPSDAPFIFLRGIGILFKEYKEQDIFYRVGFQIEDPMYINGRFALKNIIMTKCFVSSWDDLSDVPYRHLKTYDELAVYIKDYPDVTFDRACFTSDVWHVHEGDLTLDHLDHRISLIVTGDLTINEPLTTIGYELIVLGKTTLNALYLEGDYDVYLIGGITFRVALLSYGGEGSRVINDPQGPLLYTASDATLINRPQKVRHFWDRAYEHSHGDMLHAIKPKYIIEPEEDEEPYSIDTWQMAEDIREGKDIFNTPLATPQQ